MRIQAVVASLGGVARRHHLLAARITDRELLAACRQGILTRPHRGCYALPSYDPVALRARVLSARATCVSAAPMLGLPVIEPVRQHHLAIPFDRGLLREDPRRRESDRLHRTLEPDGATLTCAAWTVIDHMGPCTRPITQLAALDAALAHGLLELDDISRFTATDVRRRAWLRHRADARAGSPAETCARVEIVEAGFAVRSQMGISGVGRVDLVVEDMLVVEVDGQAYHSDPVAFSKDRRRDRALALSGTPILRFTARDALARDGRIARAVTMWADANAPLTRRFTSDSHWSE